MKGKVSKTEWTKIGREKNQEERERERDYDYTIFYIYSLNV